MNEIDDIILQSLRHIGCTFVDDDADEASTNAAAGAAASSPTAAAAADGRITRLADLPAGALLRCVVRCLQLIQPEHPSTAALPAGMPAGMAQRFAATSAVAEACTASGFTGDIGYQTFLYSNEADVRRVLMHLVERLPKDATSAKAKAAAAGTGGPAARLRALERSVARSVRLQLDAAWTPEYCKKNGIVRFKAAADDDDDYDEDDAPNGALLALQSSAHAFRPHRLNIAHPTRTFPEPPCAALRDYWAKRSPTLFQQTHGAHLCASLLHRNDADRLSELEPESDGAATDLEQDGRFERLLAVRRGHGSGPDAAMSRHKQQSAGGDKTLDLSHSNAKSVQQLQLNNVQIPNADDIVRMPEISERDTLAFDVEQLCRSIEADAQRRQRMAADVRQLREDRTEEEAAQKELLAQKRVAERTQILVENPEVNVLKMGDVLAASEARLGQLAMQWQAHRAQLVAELERANKTGVDSPSGRLLEQLRVTRERSADMSAQLAAKVETHARLLADLQKYTQQTTSRNDYTSRILEIVNNIRRQRCDIDKVLRDTRLLQKELNNVSGQLDRQFAVTDDLMFKNAKRDEHAKVAYKNLATVHADCAELVRLAEETGAIVREVRELEDQIETERSRNVAANLQRISGDLQLVVQEGGELEARLRALDGGGVSM